MEPTNADTITDKLLALKADGLQQAFLETCRTLFNAPGTQAGTQSPVSPTSTLVMSPKSDWGKSEVDPTLLTTNYADAFTDTHGLLSGAPFMFKTGSPWPKATGGLHAPAFRRKLHPISSDHPIVSVWDNILTDTIAYLKKAGETFNSVVPLGFGNADESKIFCPLVVTICVKPQTIEFETAKTVANHVKTNILTPAGFGDIDVAVWGLDMSFSGGSSAKLHSLHPMVEGPSVSPFRHPFASTLGLAIAPLRGPSYEGTLGLFMTRGDGSEILAITAAHVARPPPLFPGNRSVSEKSGEKYHDGIVALGTEAYDLAILAIQREIGNLQLSIESQRMKTKMLNDRLANGTMDDGTFTESIKEIEDNIGPWTRTINDLSALYDQVTKLMPIALNRVIGHVLFADPIGASSDKADAYTCDWAALKMRPDAFRDDFRRNMVYIGDKLDEQTFLERMFPYAADREGYGYPDFGLLQLRGVVPMDELIKFKHRDAKGDAALGVLKNGRTTGTTSGWVSGLKSGVHHHDKDNGIEFWSRELTITTHKDERGAFSEKGDSGAIIFDRGGRIVGLLTAGIGITETTDVTFATPFCQLEKRIKEVLPGARLLEPLN